MPKNLDTGKSNDFLILPIDKVKFIKNIKFKYQEKLNPYYIIFFNSALYIKSSRNSKKFILGKIFLKYQKDKIAKCNFKKDINFISKDPSNFDGNFIIINSNKKKIEIQTDSKGIFDVFYIKEKKKNFVSNSFEILTKFSENLSLNNYSIFHSLTTISKRPPKKQTFFNEISRLDLDEKIVLKNKLMFLKHAEFKPIEISKKIEEKNLLDQYDKFLNNYVSSIGSKNEIKIIFMSSGWDSLMVVEKLTKIYKSKQIKPVIARLIFSDRSKVFNRYEIYKAKKICKMFKLKLNIININYKNFSDYLKDLDPILKNKMILASDASFLHSRIIEESLKKFKTGDFFSGEISDGVHNFGFSQYCTLLDHESNGYREYADKMMTYLFGPTFIQKVIKRQHNSDPVFKLLQNKLNVKIMDISPKINMKKIITIFLESMFLPDKRFPLIANLSTIVSKSAEKKIKINFYKNYLKNIKISGVNEIYSLYIYLYNKFHWQGSTVNTAFAIAQSKKKIMANMFWDKNIHNLLSKMPEKYGRGLDIGYVKYPVKKLLSKKIDINYLNKFPHSYLSDYTNFDSNYELLFHSKMRNYIKSVFESHNPQKFLDKKFFNIDKIKILLNKFKTKDKRTSANEATLIYSLFCISKILKDVNFKI